MDQSSIIAIILFPVLILLFGSLGAIITSKKIPTWYMPLKKPKFNPPNWLFGPAWTLLYISIGFSGYIFWSEKQEFNYADTAAWFFYFFQLFLNFIWTPIFFAWNKLLLAGIVSISMVISVLINIILFCQKNVLSGCLLIPYICWISFATYLNFGIWYLNKNQKQNNDNTENIKNELETKEVKLV